MNLKKNSMRFNKLIIWVFIILKSSILLVLLINTFSLGDQEYYLKHPNYPDKLQDIINKDRMYLLVLAIPLFLSLVLDVQELKQRVLKAKWYLVSTLSLVLYVPVIKYKEYWLGYLVSALMIIGLVFILQKKYKSSAGNLV